jgi:CheY-like chemotaxis protein
VLTATDGRQALDIARREKPCVILLDHIMPIMDGKEALAELKSNPETQDIPVVIFSARGQLALGQYQGFENAALFVTKPFSPSQLRKEIQRLLEPVLSA